MSKFSPKSLLVNKIDTLKKQRKENLASSLDFQISLTVKVDFSFRAKGE